MPVEKKKPAAAPAVQPTNTMDALHERLADLSADAKVIENTADAEGRSLTTDEVAKMKEISTAFSEVEQEISARAASQDMSSKLSAPQRRQTQPEPINGAADEEPARPARTITGGAPSGATRGSWGFRSIGEFAIAAHKSKNGAVDQRIMNAPTTFGSEGNSADGGYAVPPDFREQIMKIVQGEESLLSRTDQQTTSSNALTLPLDSATPWQTSGGVLGGWFGENGTITSSKPQLGQLNCKANKVGAIVPMTDELLEDVPAMTRWLQTKVPEKFNSLINTAIVSGTGVGQPQGLLSAPALVNVTAETSQGAATIVAKNILKMWGRLYAPLRSDAVWLINQDCEQQLQQLVMPGTNPSFPAYMPPGGFSGSPYSTLLGRPIICVEACSALGTQGDIILTSLKQYLTVLKSGGMRADVSIHLYFDSDTTAFRFVMRIGGMAYWPAAITRQNGNSTLTHVVTLNSSRT